MINLDLLWHLVFTNEHRNKINEEVLGKHVCHDFVQVRSQFRKIFVAMGFEEMMTNAYVENRSARQT